MNNSSPTHHTGDISVSINNTPVLKTADPSYTSSILRLGLDKYDCFQSITYSLQRMSWEYVKHCFQGILKRLRKNKHLFVYTFLYRMREQLSAGLHWQHIKQVQTLLIERYIWDISPSPVTWNMKTGCSSLQDGISSVVLKHNSW